MSGAEASRHIEKADPAHRRVATFVTEPGVKSSRSEASSLRFA